MMHMRETDDGAILQSTATHLKLLMHVIASALPLLWLLAYDYFNISMIYIRKLRV